MTHNASEGGGITCQLVEQSPIDNNQIGIGGMSIDLVFGVDNHPPRVLV
jgi:hypothetical protein